MVVASRCVREEQGNYKPTWVTNRFVPMTGFVNDGGKSSNWSQNMVPCDSSGWVNKFANILFTIVGTVYILLAIRANQHWAMVLQKRQRYGRIKESGLNSKISAASTIGRYCCLKMNVLTTNTVHWSHLSQFAYYWSLSTLIKALILLSELDTEGFQCITVDPPVRDHSRKKVNHLWSLTWGGRSEVG